MVNLGLFSEIKPLVSVNVRFRIPYYTQWGQSLVVCGSEPVLGSGNVKKGLLLTPFHEVDELIWGGSLTVPVGFQTEYKRKFMLLEGVENGKAVELHDLWLNGSDNLPFKNAFKNVSLAIEKPLGTIQTNLDHEDTTFDAVDGKQARRTSSSSPLGELFDHGCDALACALEALAFGSTAMCGRNTFWFWVISAVPFYGATWEHVQNVYRVVHSRKGSMLNALAMGNDENEDDDGTDD